MKLSNDLLAFIGVCIFGAIGIFTALMFYATKNFSLLIPLGLIILFMYLIIVVWGMLQVGR